MHGFFDRIGGAGGKFFFFLFKGNIIVHRNTLTRVNMFQTEAQAPFGVNERKANILEVHYFK